MGMTNLERFLEKSKQVREALASIEHDQWRTWARHLLYHVDGEPNLTKRRKTRWAELINTEYEDLPEDWKDHDRIWADKTIKALGTETKDEIIRVMAEELKDIATDSVTIGWRAERALARVEKLAGKTE